MTSAARFRSAIVAVAVLGAVASACAPASAPQAFRAPRTPEGTPDLGGKSSTEDVGKAVASAI